MNEEKMNTTLSNQKGHKTDTDIIIQPFLPMIEDTMNKCSNGKDTINTASTCTRVIRKKFMCIMLLMILTIIALNFFNTVTDKLSQENVQDIYQTMTQMIRKIPQIGYNASNNITN